ncbi:MAG: extracellular solute-binding protein, partial [Chloroflexi bacterium]|nr:extracellular solute-binding protein [Chloroflexota bacterium]
MEHQAAAGVVGGEREGEETRTQLARAGLTRRQYGRAALGLTGAASAASLAACGLGEPAPAAPKSTGPVTITYLSNLPETHPEGEARLALLDEFGKTNTHQITINVDDARGGTNETKVKTLAAAGTPPDLYYTAYYFVAEFLLGGMTIDVDGELKTEKDWGKQRGDIFPPMIESSMWA